MSPPVAPPGGPAQGGLRLGPVPAAGRLLQRPGPVPATGPSVSTGPPQPPGPPHGAAPPPDAGDAELPRSQREQVDADLQLALWVLAALTFCLLPLWYLITSAPLARDVDSFPVGTHITDPRALALDDEEAERFDLDVFGTPERREPNALGDLRLPPKVPSLSDRLWIPPASSALASRQAKEALAALERCSERIGCDPRQGNVLAAALAAVSRPVSLDDETEGPLGGDGGAASPLQGASTQGTGAAQGAGPCDGQPRTSAGAIQVPLGLDAIVLAFFPECREQALERFQEFKVAVEKNIRARNLSPLYGEAGRVYARFALAKLSDPLRQPGSPEMLAEMRGIRQEILANRVLRAHYEKLDELPQWGLSMAEIHGEWLMSEAREAARQGRGRGLTARLARLLDPEVLAHLPPQLNQSPGQERLQLAWCALALRANVPAGESDLCLGTLADAPSFPTLHCAVLARMAMRSGLWDHWPRLDTDCTSDREGSPELAARSVLERLAGSPRVWQAALSRYLDSGIDPGERASLLGYLGSHAGQSFLDSGIWFAVQHPWLFAGLLVYVILLSAGWVALAWAYGIRRPTLYRFLPPRLQADTPT